MAHRNQDPAVAEFVGCEPTNKVLHLWAVREGTSIAGDRDSLMTPQAYHTTMSDTPELPDANFDVIYADPPWSYDQDTPQGGVAHQYDTMSLDEIKALDVPTADDCILYLWGTVTHVPEAVEVIDAWGFEYKSQAVWDKQRYGVGYWFRGQHELLYVATKGDVSPPKSENRRESIFREQSGEHSSKPDKVRAHIEQAHPEAEKLELFSRDGRVGWTMWGDEVVDEPQDTLERYV